MAKGPVIIRCMGRAGVPAGAAGADPTGAWLVSWDLEARRGRGQANWTRDPAKAHVFPDFRAAFEAWRGQSVNYPARPDGQPNRPLTAYSVTFDPAPAAGAP